MSTHQAISEIIYKTIKQHLPPNITINKQRKSYNITEKADKYGFTLLLCTDNTTVRFIGRRLDEFINDFNLCEPNSIQQIIKHLHTRLQYLEKRENQNSKRRQKYHAKKKS